ncbi:MAG TPA: hypothetical protein VGI81_23585 [Tepidisphaeraceae bacterium]
MELHQLVRSLPSQAFPPDAKYIPLNGVYFVFERGERGHEGERIVRVGSHTGDGHLASRLAEHLTPNKDRSIFRKNIGRALLYRESDPYARVWELDFTKREIRDKYGHLRDLAKQEKIEAAVSEYIKDRFAVRVIGLSSCQLALDFEKLCIGTVSACPACIESDEWLGRHSSKPKIRSSGMWQEQHLFKACLSRDDLKQLRHLAFGGCPEALPTWPGR